MTTQSYYVRLLLALCLWIASAQAIINATFRNCLSDSVTNPRFTPKQVDATYNVTSHTLSFTVHGNMTGSVADTNADGTLASAVVDTVFIAGYMQTKNEHRLCNVTYSPFPGYTGPLCPFGPGMVDLAFTSVLPKAYTFSTLTNNIRINAPKDADFEVACFEVELTPPLTDTVDKVLTYVTLAVLLLVGIKVVLVAILNPWSGTLDPYRAFSNFGFDENAVRLLTPGFGDCLGYIQFAAYTSMLSLDYPGFFQRVTSRISWSLLLFDSSPVTSSLDYTPQLGDSIASYINFVGARRQDAWSSFMVWWLIVQACVVAFVCLLLFAWWVVTPSSFDLSRKNFPFIGGAMLRVYLWWLVPLAIFTSYQLLSAQSSDAGLVAGAALVLMILVILVPGCLVWFLPRHSPRQDLYDDLTLLSIFGPLYNTLTTPAFLYFVPTLVLAICRALVVGLLASYGTAQLSCLLVIEAIAIVAVVHVRPWAPRTNTTMLSIIVGIARLAVLFFMLSFVPSLKIAGGRREWLGYIILITHACVLVFVFLGTTLLSLLELAIRLLVIVPQDEGAKAIFGARQLRSRRNKLNQQYEKPPGDVNPNDDGQRTSSITHLIDEGKNGSPFFRRPRAPSRMQFRADSPADYRSLNDADSSGGAISPASFGRPGSSAQTKRTYSYGSEELLSSMDPGLQSSRSNILDGPSTSSTDLSMAYLPNEEAAKRGVDYAVREADVYHPQSTGELLGPSKKLGTGPADPNGIKFRKLNFRPWRVQPNPEKGKFVVVRSSPQHQQLQQQQQQQHSQQQQQEQQDQLQPLSPSTSQLGVPLQELSESSTARGYFERRSDSEERRRSISRIDEGDEEDYALPPIASNRSPSPLPPRKSSARRLAHHPHHYNTAAVPPVPHDRADSITRSSTSTGRGTLEPAEVMRKLSVISGPFANAHLEPERPTSGDDDDTEVIGDYGDIYSPTAISDTFSLPPMNQVVRNATLAANGNGSFENLGSDGMSAGSAILRPSLDERHLSQASVERSVRQAIRPSSGVPLQDGQRAEVFHF